MSIQSADTAGECGRAVSALIAADPGPASRPWSSTYKCQGFDGIKSSGPSGNQKQYQRHDQNEYDTDGAVSDGEAFKSVTNRLSGLGKCNEADLCASTWKSVESMARTLVLGQSVLSTISKCYSLPDLGRTSSRGAFRRFGRAGTETMSTSLVSDRLAAEALAVFRRLGQAPLTQPDGLYINSSKIPEAAKALDPSVDDATIRVWMECNGFAQGTPSASVEALSWTEYRRALSELCPAFRRHGISMCSTDSDTARGTTEAYLERILRRDTSPSQHDSGLPIECCCDAFEATAGGGGAPMLFPSQHRSRTEMAQDSRRGVEDIPPRSPGADSYHVLRRKRHAAVSVDYESVTKQLPQVMPPLDPSILVDHVKAQGRRERKNPASETGGSSLWTLDPHERLLKMTLQKAQVSETANPRLVQPRHAAVKIRSRRNEFNRRREAEGSLIARLSRNAGIIGRHGKVAEARARRRQRNAADHQRVETQRIAESKRSALVRAGAEQRARERRLNTEMLKSCIADQLRTIQHNEAKVVEGVRVRRRVLHKGEGIARMESMSRVRSLPTFGRNYVEEHVRKPFQSASIPPPGQDARWIFSSDKPLQSSSGVATREHVSPPTSLLSDFRVRPTRQAPEDVAPGACLQDAITPPTPATRDGRVVGGKDVGEVGSRGGVRVGVDRTTTSGTTGCTAAEEPQFWQSARVGQTRRRGSVVGAAKLHPKNQRSARLCAGGNGKGGRYGVVRRPTLKTKEPTSLPGLVTRRRPNVDIGTPASLSLWGGSPSVSSWCDRTASPVDSDNLAYQSLAVLDGRVVDWGDD